MSQEIAPADLGLPQGLTQPETEYIYLVEVLGMPARKAAKSAGVKPGTQVAPHILQASDMVRRKLRGDLRVTKERVTEMYFDAIDRARLLSEPATEIMGIDKLVKLHGLDAPQRIDVNITASIEVLKEGARNMSDAELARLIGAGDVIDGDFYEVNK